MSEAKRLLWIVLTGVGVACFAWLGVSEVGDLQRTPEHPADRTLAELQSGDVPRWIRVTDGVPRCDQLRRANDHDVVPVVPLTAVQSAAPTHALWVALEQSELCASMQPPLLLRPLRRSAYAQRVLYDLSPAPGQVVGDDVFGLEPDAWGEARVNAVVPFGLMLGCIAALAVQLRARRKAKSIHLSAVGDIAAAPSAGVFAALVQGSTARPDEGVLPTAPLSVSAATLSQAFRAMWVAPSLLVLSSVGFFGLSSWGTAGVVNDLRAWYGGVEVAAELKGSTSSKLIVSVLDVQVAWQMPGERDVRSASRMFMTLWKPDNDIGAVRALVDQPDVVTFEEAVDLVPLRVPLLLAGFGLAIGCLLNARTARRNAGRVSWIAATAVEDVLHSPSFAETRANGATTGWVIAGLLDGKPVQCSIAANPGPAGLVLADAAGGVLVARSADGAYFTPIFVDGEPFAWTPGAWAHAQVVLQARGSPTRLLG